ncbi:MAG: hypothetical protein KDD45_03840 [Bdellovibrionales bacterium]|nr:hypothetical protein [Bdellovibrionales bacterium]
MDISIKKDNRKVLMILPHFQKKFLRFLILMSLLVCVVFYGAIFGFIQYWHHLGINAGLPDNSVFFDFLDQMRISLGYILAVALILTTIIIITLGLYMSHKVAGPIYNVLNYFKEIKANGWVRPLSFRKNDFFPELTDALNSFMDEQKISKQD